MPRRWCSDQPCNELVTPPATRCDQHQAAADTRAAARRARATAGRPTTTARGYGTTYRKRRDAIVNAGYAAAAAGEPKPCDICQLPCLATHRLVAHHPDGNPAAADPRTCRLELAHESCNNGYRHPA